jgi:sporulation protein YlmC with PRC-barrel domain
MATAPDLDTRPALMPVGRLCGADVLDPAGEKLGTITEVMLDTGSGGVAYAVLSHGGLLGVGEKLFAVPFRRLAIDALAGTVATDLDSATLDALPGFDKDAWPTAADPSL